MKPSDRIAKFVAGRRLERAAKGAEVAAPRNVSTFVKDPEVAAYISKLLEVIDDLEARVAKIEAQPVLVSYPRSAQVRVPKRP